MWRRPCAAALASVLLALSWRGAAATERSDENTVKAAVIYNLLLFVQWPPQPSPPASFRFCLLDEGALAAALRRHEGRAVQDRPLEIRRVGATPEEVAACDATLVEAGAPAVLSRLGAMARSRALLVIAEGAGVVDRGAMIGLHTDGGRVTFDINHGAMKRSGLTPSSQILRLARTLIE